MFEISYEFIDFFNTYFIPLLLTLITAFLIAFITAKTILDNFIFRFLLSPLNFSSVSQGKGGNIYYVNSVNEGFYDTLFITNKNDFPVEIFDFDIKATINLARTPALNDIVWVVYISKEITFHPKNQIEQYKENVKEYLRKYNFQPGGFIYKNEFNAFVIKPKETIIVNIFIVPHIKSFQRNFNSKIFFSPVCKYKEPKVKYNLVWEK